MSSTSSAPGRLGTAVRSGARLALGRAATLGRASIEADALSWPLVLETLRGVPAVLSVDVFETLLRRSQPGGAALRRAVASEAIRLAAPQARLTADESRARERRVGSRLRRTARARGADPEIGQRDFLRALIADTRGQDPSVEELDRLCALALALEHSNTTVVPGLHQLLRVARERGVRTIVLSDTQYSAQELSALLAGHGIVELDRIYSSSDSGASKFTGRLYRVACERESVMPQQLLHVGDDAASDVWSARVEGIRSIRVVRRPSNRGDDARAEPGFALGRDVLGPALVTFAHLLLRQAARDGIERLACLARDGELLADVLGRCVPHAPLTSRPEVSYVHLSRRSTQLAGTTSIELADAADALAARATNAGATTLLAGYDIPVASVADLLTRHGFTDPSAPILRPHADARLRSLLEDETFRERVRHAAEHRRAVLRSYLTSEHILGADGRTALVDIGWRGTIQSTLLRAYPELCEEARPLVGYYLGLWDDGITRAPEHPALKHGVLCDLRRGRTLDEGAAWHLAFLFESVCRAPHSPVVGYARGDDGSVAPVLAPDDWPARAAERRSEAAREPIRAGISAFVDSQAARLLALECADEPAARRRVQARLRRLAFFPSAAELSVASGLYHTETAAAHWSTSLLGQAPVRPWMAPRRWLAGLSAPWRGGYVALTGGRLMSTAYVAAEAAMVRMPARTRQRLRDAVLRTVHGPSPRGGT